MADEWSGTAEQQQAVDRLLAASGSGVYVRTLPDGSVEVLTGSCGVLERHRVASDGTSVLVESRPRDKRFWRALILWCLGFGLFVVYGIAGFAITDTPTSDAPWWVIVPTLAGFFLFAAGMFLMPGPHSLTRGEHWARVGFEE